ncbi:DUF2813 domain-containing protein [Wohlfahrtiimonas chitiniclastica]|uniref:DUF2813 domain-containing protein n=1 Tax=Wohlfahrtiimonas chitiniclastica TaxID=400946 RepID=UPI0021584DE2|nr:DUF2813 domain-containing protein [Wohlfahrtiimonas chitiniclastica]MDC7251951.1 hypothetical protein [Wohlfahrtiimonas chitiniclastica]
MLLHSIEIQGFKGIRELTINLNDDVSVLIGENSWGSSSLISALAMITKENFLYQCQPYDFFEERDCPNDCLRVRFIYQEHPTEKPILPIYPELQAISYLDEGNAPRICYEVSARKMQDTVITQHRFVDGMREPIVVDDFEARLQCLIDLNPLLILRGSAAYEAVTRKDNERIESYYNLLVQQLTKDTHQLTDRELEQGLYAATLLLTYYLVSHKSTEEHIRKPTLEDWQVLDKINDLLDQLDNSAARNVMMRFFTSVIFHRMGYSLSEHALPILFLKDFGGSIHPTIMSVGMRLLGNLPIQKILTSNSSDLIPIVSLHNVLRISRADNEIVVNQVLPNALSKSTQRKVTFHIFHRRPIALFARCWFLVEGETEIWLLKELAEVCGYNLSAEGITLVEFAQCGVMPLVEYAQAMGIEWYVMADGDAAGKHYAKLVRTHCKNKDEYYRHVTRLPARDIENFLFQKGFSSVYKHIAYGSDDFVDKPVHEIIQRAVQKTSKPDLAIAVCDHARLRGMRSVPLLLRKTFEKVINLSKGTPQS